MACFNEQDMKDYMRDLGHTVTVEDIEKDYENHFIQALKLEIQKSGVKALLSQYAPLVTMMKRGDKLDGMVQKGIMDIVNLAIWKIYEYLEKIKQNLSDLDTEENKYLQRVVGIIIWLSYTILEEFSYFGRVANEFTNEKRVRGRSKTSSAENRPFGFWVKGRINLLEALLPFLKLNLLPLWEPNVNLVNKKVFYELIMHATSNCVKNGAKDIMRDSVLSKLIQDIFHYFIKNLDMEDQLLRTLMFNIVGTEDMARAVCKILTGLKQELHLPNIIRKAIARAMEVIQNPEYRDKMDKGFTVFLLEIGTTFPAEIMESSMPYVVQFVDSDVVALRNAVLCILVEIVICQKNQIDEGKISQDENTTRLRQKLLAYIEDFICDVNAAVRSKAVNLLSKMVELKGLTIDETLSFSREVADRLLDCAATTRKNSFNFFMSLINAEPIIAKYSPTKFHEFALEQRRTFLQKRVAHVKSDKKETLVNIYVKEFTDYIAQTYMGQALRNRPMIDELKAPDTAVEHISKLIKEMKIWEACECFYRATLEYANEEHFRSVVDNHSFDIYRAYIGGELGIDLASLQEHSSNELNQSASELLESGESEDARRLHHHLHVCETLSELLAEAIIPTALLLLEKGTSADQTEALSFFGTLSMYEYPFPPNVELTILDVVSGMNQSVVGNILESFSLIFLKGPDCESPLGLMKILVGLCNRLGTRRRNHISFLIEEMVAAKRIHVQELKILWDIVTLRVPNFGHTEAKVALYILYICGKADRKCIQSLHDSLIDVALGQRGLEDMEFAHLGLLTLGELLGSEKNSNLATRRLEANSPVFAKIYDVIKYCLHPETRDRVNEHFIDVMDVGVSLIYNHCLQPVILISHLVRDSYYWLFANINSIEVDGEEITYEHELDEGLMLKVVTLAAAITGVHASYHSHTILEEVKKRKAFRQIDAIHTTPAIKQRLRRSFVELSSRRRSSGQHKMTFTDSLADSMLKADHEELEAVVGQIGFDREIDIIRNFMESLLDSGAISFYWQFILYTCRRYHKIQSSRLRIATLRLFGQCMLIGSKAMEIGMEIFVKLWKYVTAPSEKMEMIIMAILLNDCYPNKMQNCNNLIMTGLTSEHVKVRLMALDFVIFLTQTDVLKLREILPDTILCLADECEDIREVTKNFLRDCQEKDTMLHSSIPDMVIRTSGNENISQEKFRMIMQSFLQPFKKVTEVAGIVDKLVDRFSKVGGISDRAAEDNAYCLSLLTYNERSFKIIREWATVYAKYLGNKFIYNCFLKVLESARQSWKGDVGDLNDYAERILEYHEKYSHISRQEIQKTADLN